MLCACAGVILLCALYTSCSNIFSAVSNKTEESSGNSSQKCSITVSFAGISSASRSAFPEVSDNTTTGITTFYGMITDTNGNTVSTLSKMEGSSGTYVYSPDGLSSLAGIYTFHVYGFRKDVSNYNTTTAAVTGSSSITIVSGVSAYTLSGFSLGANSDYTIKTGGISLGITAESGVTINTVKASLSGNTSLSSYINGTLSFTDITAGTYTMTMLFYGNTEATKLIYSRTESVTVWPNCTTSVWYFSDGKNSSSLTIKKADLYTTFYIKGSGCTSEVYKSGGDFANVAASNSNTGGIADPFADLQPAVDSLIASGQSGTIYVDGTVKYKSNGSNGTNAMVDMTSSVAQTITIKSMSNTNAVIDGGSTKRVMYVSGTTNSETFAVTLNNITIQNGAVSDSGAGIEVTMYSTLYLSGACKICNNIASSSTVCGGGLYIGLASKVQLAEGTVITGNKSAGDGGGIYCAAASLYLVGSSDISGNYCSGSGAGICIANNGNFYQGTIASTPTTGIAGTAVILDSIKDNRTGWSSGTSYTGIQDVYVYNKYIRITAPDSGRAINTAAIGSALSSYKTESKTSGTVYLGKSTESATWSVTSINVSSSSDASLTPSYSTGKSTISGTGASGSGSVFSIANPSGTVTLSNLIITKGYSSASGGGICMSGAGILAITGCTISSNTATTSGGGIYASAGTVSVDGSTSITGNTAANGGGVYIAGATFRMPAVSSVTGNTASDATTGTCGGIYIASGNFYSNTGTTAMTGTSSILDNVSANNSYNSTGLCDVYDTVNKFIRISSSGTVAKNTVSIGNALSSCPATGTVYLGKSTESATWNVTSIRATSSSAATLTPSYSTSQSTISGTGASGSGSVFSIANTSGTVTLSNLIITKGYSSTNGGGIYKSGAGSIQLDSCTVTANTATANGSGIYQPNTSSGTIIITGSTQVTSDNDIYLPSGNMISLNNATPSKTFVAIITPSAFDSQKVLSNVKADTDVTKFSVPDSGTTLYYVAYSSGSGILMTNGLSGGGSSEDDPYRIYTAAQMAYFRTTNNSSPSTYAGKYIKLMKSINLSSVCNSTAGNWVPIGYDTDTAFQGTFDGNNGYTYSGLGDYSASGTNGNTVTISNLYFNDSEKTYKYIGLFGAVSGTCTIKNVTLSGSITENYSDTGQGYSIGGIVGVIFSDAECTISDCINMVSITSKYQYAGGIVGYMYTPTSVTLTKCTNAAALTMTSAITPEGGGIAGYAENSTISYCTNSGTLSLLDSSSAYVGYAGGMIGLTQSSISYCLNTGNITGEYAGGIAGWKKPGRTITDCTNSGTITGTKTGDLYTE